MNLWQQWSLINISPAIGWLAMLFVGALATGLWYLIRKRHKRDWFPILRVLDLEKQKLPKLQLYRPPLLAFLCFLGALLSFLFFGLRPERRLPAAKEPQDTHVHVLVDLSPSVSAHIGTEQLRRKVAEVYAALKPAARVTLSSTLEAEIFEPDSDESLQVWLQRFDFHRAGILLGQTISERRDQFGDVDSLLIVSDGDQHSWNDFNWQYLQSEMNVKSINLAENIHPSNVSVHQVQPNAQGGEWQVELWRTGGLASAVSGRISFVENETGDTLQSQAWTISANQVRAELRVPWTSKWHQVKTIRAELTTDVDEDALAADNVFRFRAADGDKVVAIVSPRSGEVNWEDPAHHLSAALEAMGFSIKRLDEIDASQEVQANLWIVIGGAGTGIETFCPLHLRNWSDRPPSGIENKSPEVPARVWLLPISQRADFKELCHCYVKLALRDSGSTPPEYCNESASQPGWASVLRSTGSVQVGGKVGNDTQALAWHFEDKKAQFDLLSFSWPINPNLGLGVSYGNLPSVLKAVMNYQDDSISHVAFTSWPRWEHLPVGELSLDSNVPIGESRLTSMDQAAMPEIWRIDGGQSRQEWLDQADTGDSRGFIKMMIALISLALLIEILGHLWQRWRSYLWAKGAVLFAVFWCFRPPSLLATVQVVEINATGPVQLERLAEDMSARTSIDLATAVKSSSALTQEHLAEPWLWVNQAEPVSSSQSTLRADVVAWIKRGGLLILQGDFSDQRLHALTEGVFEGGLSEATWKAIPPDHELMRSFYLLDSLPICREQVWRGFHFDQRMAILAIPFRFLESLSDVSQAQTLCNEPPARERATRIFVNLSMAALATDYKNDQIHLPAILKRLRK